MRIKPSLFHLSGILLLGCAACGTAGASTLLYYNLADTATVYDQLTSTLYQSFTSGSTSLMMDDLQLNLLGVTPYTGSFAIGLYSDSSNTPNTLLLSIATEEDSSLTATAAVYDFPVADYALSANTQYWIGLAPTTVDAKWGGATVQAGDTGTSGQSIDLGGLVYPSNSNFAFLMSIDAVPLTQSGVPEPSSGLLLGAGLAVAWWARRARAKILAK